jgi:hypothetical protein
MDDDDDDEVKYQRAAGILRDFHSTQCFPPLNVIREDLDDDDDDDDDDSNNKKVQSERHLFEFSGLISRSDTVACLTALAQQEESAFRKEQGKESLSGSAAKATSDGTASATMLSKRKPPSFSSSRRRQSPLSSQMNL